MTVYWIEASVMIVSDENDDSSRRSVCLYTTRTLRMFASRLLDCADRSGRLNPEHSIISIESSVCLISGQKKIYRSLLLKSETVRHSRTEKPTSQH
jgi:hypothetical protein